MEHIYLQSNDNFEVFTTVISPQASRARNRYWKREGEKMVVATNCQPETPDELELCQGDVIHVLFKDDDSWWFGRLQNGQEGYFPSTSVTKLIQQDEPAKVSPSSLKRSSIEPVAADVLGAGAGERRQESQMGGEEGLFRALRPGASLPLAEGPAHRSPGLLRRILSKPRRKGQRQGATNGAFQPD